MTSLYILIGIPAFFIVFLTVVARLEKRMVWPYGKPEALPQFGDPFGYGARCVGEARQAGFSFMGWSPDLKGPRYQVSYALLSSPERDCFVIIGVGAVLSMQVRGTWIYTRATDGRVFYTTDEQSCVEIDASHRWRSQLVYVPTFTGLLRSHRDLLRDRGVTAQPMAAGREVEEFRSIREEHYQAMFRQGLIAFTDPSALYWRYTFWGALKWAVLNCSIGTLRTLTGGRLPRTA